MAGTPEEKGVGPEQRLCKCHGLPMIKKGRLRCAVKYRAKQARYEKTEKGRASQRRKNQSEAGCRAKIKHAHSEKGKATCVRNRARNSPRRIYGYGGQYLGSVSAKKAERIAYTEYEKFRKEEDKKYISDFDREVRKILKKK